MTTEMPPASDVSPRPGTAVSTGESFLNSLARRDFEGMARCLAPEVRFRALLPPRDVDVIGPEAALAEFRRWFGDDAERIELVESTVEEVGPRLYLRWRIRLTGAGDRATSRTVEQHAYATAGDRLETLSLLCSGFFSG